MWSPRKPVSGFDRDRLVTEDRLLGVRCPLRVWPAVWQSQSSRGLTLGTRVESARDQGKNRRARMRSRAVRAEGASRPRSRARVTASARRWVPSLAYRLRIWVLTVLDETYSSPAISGPVKLVGR